MGCLIDGVWTDQWYDTSKSGGRFLREDSQLRNWITPDGTPGPSGEGGFRAEVDRYHLYVSLACPWAHRTLVFRKLKGLEDLITVSVVHPHMLGNGWEFRENDPTLADELYGSECLHQIYTRARLEYTGRVTVPVLWDTLRETIVSNESSEIIRMLNSAFNKLTGNALDFYPEALREEIAPLNERIYTTLNNGVYRCGFATKQEAYEEAFTELFDTLDFLEERLAGQRYLCGNTQTEADWRLFPTLIRFDAVYHGHFKCNRNRIVDFPNLFGYVRDLYQHPGIRNTVDFWHIRQHYHYSHDSINPHRIVPKGPDLAPYNLPHQRAGLSQESLL
jgi:putative glutathione S-transferase